MRQTGLMKTRVCNNYKCKKRKPITAFYNNVRGPGGIDYACKACRKREVKEHTRKHKAERSVYNKKWKTENKEHVQSYNKIYLRQYYKKNRRHIIKTTSANSTRRRRTYIQERLKNNLRRRLHHALKGTNKSKRTMELVGCKIEFLVLYLASKFKKGMTWDNYGKNGWGVDHIVALNNFDLTIPAQLEKATHFTNLQPLWQADNSSKGDRPQFPEGEIKNSPRTRTL